MKAESETGVPKVTPPKETNSGRTTEDFMQVDSRNLNLYYVEKFTEAYFRVSKYDVKRGMMENGGNLPEPEEND